MIQRLNKTAAYYRPRLKVASEFNSLTLSKKQASNLTVFCVGFIIYNISYVAPMSDISEALTIALCQGFQALGLFLIIIGAANLIKFKFESSYLQAIFVLYIIFSITVVCRGGEYDFNTIKQLLFNAPFCAFSYLAPLVVLFPKSPKVYKRIIDVALLFGLYSILFVFNNFKLLRSFVWDDIKSQGSVETYFFCLILPLGFLLMNYIYYNNKKRLFAFIMMFICLYFLIFRARRGAMFMCASTLAGAAMVYLIYNKKQKLIIALTVVLVAISSLLASNIKLPHMFDTLVARLDNDTRSGVEVAMIADMKPIDWVIGKGVNGSYYCPGIDMSNDANGRRNIIETGYLQIILKGGLVSLSLLGLIILPAIYLGFFKSSNVLSKASAMFILLWIMYTYPANVSGFTIHYIILWFCVGICYSPKLRNLPDDTIKKYMYS